MTGNRHPYCGRRMVLLTRHGKEAMIGPVLANTVGARVEGLYDYDTDQLGTFTREIPRRGTQMEAARRKAQIGMELSGCPLGLASEGAFGMDPYAGFMPWNTEIVVFLDTDRGLEITGTVQGPAHNLQRTIHDWQAMRRFAEEAGFPDDRLVLRANDENNPRLRKGIDNWEDLEQVFHQMLDSSETGAVFAEHDLRAHCHAPRREMIRQAAMDLAEKLGSLCPACGCPGFWVSDYVRGLPCEWCQAPTREVLADIWSCPYCEHREQQQRPGREFADPGRCDYCNP